MDLKFPETFIYQCIFMERIIYNTKALLKLGFQNQHAMHVCLKNKAVADSILVA